MNKYDSYKDSGVRWIGEIPSHWILNKVGNNTYVKGRIGWKGLRSEDFIDEGPYLITGTDFNTDGSINWDKMYHVCQERYDEDPFIQLKDHDVLITKDGTIGKVVYVGELKGQTCLNSGIFLTRPLINEYLPKYFYWVLNSNVFKVFVDYNSGGSTIQHLYQNVFINFKIPLPSIPEQHQIVSFLDHKTTLIDTLIQKTQEKINLLREKRTSLINHTVTKGLNPDVEMKDSGVEWIGEIPKHWIRIKGKYIIKILTGNYPSEIVEENGGVFFTKVDDLNTLEDNYYLTNSNLKINPHGIEPLEEGIILFPKRGMTIYTNKVVITKIKTFIDPNLMGVRVLHNYNIKFFFHLLTNRGLGDICDSSTIPQINNKHIYPLEFPFPPLQEQQQIIEYLDEQTLRIDTLIQKEEKRIELLKEYRQTLISDVVTGKIKVTDHE